MKSRAKEMILAFLIVPLLLAPAVATRAQGGVIDLPSANSEILGGFDSWSLFLICNPKWLVQNGDEGIRTLFERYKAFGNSIGPRNSAVWFSKEPTAVPTVELTDVSRSSEYCRRYKLLPSRSPHVLVTTRHPDTKEAGDYFFVSLNGVDASDSADALAELTDQLLVTGLNQAGLDDNVRWQRILSAVVAAMSSVGSYFDSVSFTFNTGLFKAEIAHKGS